MPQGPMANKGPNPKEKGGQEFKEGTKGKEGEGT